MVQNNYIENMMNCSNIVNAAKTISNAMYDLLSDAVELGQGTYTEYQLIEVYPCEYGFEVFVDKLVCEEMSIDTNYEDGELNEYLHFEISNNETEVALHLLNDCLKAADAVEEDKFLAIDEEFFAKMAE